MRLRLGAAALCMALLLTGCGAAAQKSSSDTGIKAEVPSASADIFAMDTYMTVTCYGERCEEAVEAAENEIRRLDDLLSVGNEDSEISRINRDGTGTVSEDTVEMVAEALSLYHTTGGAFDITVYPLMELWGFTTGDDQIPDQEAIDVLLPLVDDSAITLDGNSAYAGVVSATDLSIDTSGGVVFLFYVFTGILFSERPSGT